MCGIYGDWFEHYMHSFLLLRNINIDISFNNLVRLVSGYVSHLEEICVSKSVKKNLFFIFSLSRFSDKFIYFFLSLRFFSSDWRVWRFFLRKRRNALKKQKKTVRPYKKGILFITFKKKNIFFNIASNKSKSLHITTLRRLGFLGRKRREYLSIWSAIRSIKKIVRVNYKIRRLALVYKGWNRFRIAIKNSLRHWDQYKVPLLYIKFIIKIPHNGCRPKKKKKKKRKPLVRLKKYKKKLIFNAKKRSFKKN